MCILMGTTTIVFDDVGAAIPHSIIQTNNPAELKKKQKLRYSNFL